MEPGRIYHLYNHGNADDNLFRSDENYRYFLNRYGQLINSVVDTYAYCLLPNHFHLLARVKELTDLRHLTGFINLSGVAIEERIVQHFSNFFNGYTKAFNKRYNRRGKLFLTPFKRKPIETTKQFLSTWRYIHLNPVSHRFTEDPYEWPFSSIHDFRLNKSSLLSLLDTKASLRSRLESFRLNELITNLMEPLEFDY